MTIKPVFFSMILLAFSNIVNAQNIQEIISKPFEQVMPIFDKTFATSKVNNAKLVGLGDLGIFAKETKKVNAYLASYLISKKGFRNIMLKVDDWTLRPLNDLLKSPSALKSVELDSVIKTIFRTDFQFRNTEFKSLLEWIKNFNLAHPKDLVNIYGAGADDKIPPSYLLTNYIYRADPLEARKLSKNWAEETISDSLAYTEIAKWIKSQRLYKSPIRTKQIVDSCENDLLHNNSVITITSFGQKNQLNKWERRTTYIANQILSKQSKKTIFYALTSEVGRCFAKSPLVGDDKIQTVGKVLGDQLKEQYFVIVTDFINKANLALINPATGDYKIVMYEGSEQVRKLNEQKYYLEIESEKNPISNYLPAIIDAFDGIQTKLITLEQNRITDGIILLSDISGVDFSY